MFIISISSNRIHPVIFLYSNIHSIANKLENYPCLPSKWYYMHGCLLNNTVCPYRVFSGFLSVFHEKKIGQKVTIV